MLMQGLCARIMWKAYVLCVNGFPGQIFKYGKYAFWLVSAGRPVLWLAPFFRQLMLGPVSETFCWLNPYLLPHNTKCNLTWKDQVTATDKEASGLIIKWPQIKYCWQPQVDIYRVSPKKIGFLKWFEARKPNLFWDTVYVRRPYKKLSGSKAQQDHGDK